MYIGMNEGQVQEAKMREQILVNFPINCGWKDYMC